MAATLTKGTKDRPIHAQLSELRDALVAEQERLRDLLAKAEAALQGHPIARQKEPVATDSASNLAGRRPSPLDALKGILNSTADLRLDHGRLSAERVATLYGIPLSHLAQWMGRSKQAVGKTPDADSLQVPLGHLERIARLRLLMKGDAEFRKWLRATNSDLGGESPLDELARGKSPALADWVEDILTGSPG